MLELKDIEKRLGGFVLGPVSLLAGESDYYVLAGPSGAGKSKILEIACGITPPDAGSVWLGGRNITRMKLQDRKIGMVFQENTLFPHLTVRQNIGFPMAAAKVKPGDTRKEIDRLAALTGISHLLGRYTEKLSGGEARRVTLARALASQPRLLLLDEPLNGVDAALRPGLRQLFRDINRSGIPVVHVTHDHDDAYALATKVGIILNGQIVQQGSPGEVFLRPANSFVASYAGIRNYYRCRIEPDGQEGLVKAVLPGGMVIQAVAKVSDNEGSVVIPASDVLLSLARLDSSARNQFRGTITDLLEGPVGVEVITDCGIPIASLVSRQALGELQLEKGKEIWVSFKASAVRVF
jgi:molybdopterin-binding protein